MCSNSSRQHARGGLNVRLSPNGIKLVVGNSTSILPKYSLHPAQLATSNCALQRQGVLKVWISFNANAKNRRMTRIRPETLAPFFPAWHSLSMTLALFSILEKTMSATTWSAQSQGS